MSRRCSSEIASCVYIHLQELDKSRYKNVNLFADGCPGQNKNTIVASMLLHFIRTSKYIQEVSLRFFETNHGQNEGDSCHSAISSAVGAEGEILVPSKLPSVIVKARVDHPYKVHPMCYSKFYDFKSFSQNLSLLSIRRNDDKSGSINWTEVMEVHVVKSDPTKLFYKNSHLWDQYKSITVKKKIDDRIPKLNNEKIKIAAAKFKDLVSLCEGDVHVIRNDADISFYKSLPHLET